tara:strand:+ start:364 stop:945 length:582 start_codon:yes stop_codon:yes gene_type:complete
MKLLYLWGFALLTTSCTAPSVQKELKNQTLVWSTQIDHCSFQLSLSENSILHFKEDLSHCTSTPEKTDKAFKRLVEAIEGPHKKNLRTLMLHPKDHWRAAEKLAFSSLKQKKRISHGTWITMAKESNSFETFLKTLEKNGISAQINSIEKIWAPKLKDIKNPELEKKLKNLKIKDNKRITLGAGVVYLKLSKE